MNLLGTLLMMYKVLVRQDTYPAFLPCRVSSLACSLCQHALNHAMTKDHLSTCHGSILKGSVTFLPKKISFGR